MVEGEPGIDTALVDGHRVRRARELRGLTQAELAHRSGAFTPAALSQIERGHTKPSRPTLAAICNATGMPANYFAARADTEEPPGFFRGLRSMPARTRKSHLPRASALRDLVNAISQLVRLPEVTVPRYDLADFGSIDAVADQLRQEWELPPGPVDSVIRSMERHGCIMVRQDGFEDSVDAYSVRYPDHCIVVLGRTKGVATRSRFDAAHELAHLLLHSDDDAGSSVAEKQAQAFASAFLMPRRDIESELPHVADFDRLLQLKNRWRVSMQALLYRSRALGVMPEHRVHPGDEADLCSRLAQERTRRSVRGFARGADLARARWRTPPVDGHLDR